MRFVCIMVCRHLVAGTGVALRCGVELWRESNSDRKEQQGRQDVRSAKVLDSEASVCSDVS